MKLALVPIAVLLALPLRAAAQEGPPPESSGHSRPREAVELYQRAREEYRLGQYEAAAQDLESALVLDPGSPTLLYNLARVYELSGQLPLAMRAYRNYQRVITDEAERERIEATLQRLEGAQSFRRPDEEEYSQPIYVTQRGVADDAFWVTLIAGGVAVVGAGAVGLATIVVDAQRRDLVLGLDGITAADYQAQASVVGSMANATDVLAAIGGGALLTAALLWLLRERTIELYPEAHRPMSFRLSPWATGSASGASAGVEGRF